jgi:NDP-sugar pyrophosphorylase family protein
MLSPLDFFDLTEFAHRGIFEGLGCVWQALDRLPDYLESHVEAKVLGQVSPAAALEGPVLIGMGTVVEPCAAIIGPAIIGDHCRIRHGAYLRGGVLLGSGCVVGHCSEIKGSIMLDGAKAPHFNYVGDSILGNGVNLGAGTVCANLRLDGCEVFVRTGDSKKCRIGTGRRKLGAILGDGVKTGCCAVLNPGTLIGKGATVPPCACVNRYSAARR